MKLWLHPRHAVLHGPRQHQSSSKNWKAQRFRSLDRLLTHKLLSHPVICMLVSAHLPPCSLCLWFICHTRFFCLSACLPACLPVYVCVCACLAACLSFCTCVCVCVSACDCLRACVPATIRSIHPFMHGCCNVYAPARLSRTFSHQRMTTADTAAAATSITTGHSGWLLRSASPTIHTTTCSSNT